MRWNWRFWQSDNDRLTEKAVEESRMTPYERDIDQEDYEARKDDNFVEQFEPGSREFEENVNNE